MSLRVKRIGTNKETEYDEPVVIDEVWEYKDGKLVKVEVKPDDAETGE